MNKKLEPQKLVDLTTLYLDLLPLSSDFKVKHKTCNRSKFIVVEIISTDSQDKSKIIGSEGKNIKALRYISRIISEFYNTKCNIQVID